MPNVSSTIVDREREQGTDRPCGPTYPKGQRKLSSCGPRPERPASATGRAMDVYLDVYCVRCLSGGLQGARIAREESIAESVELGGQTLYSACGCWGKRILWNYAGAPQLSLLLIKVLQLRSHLVGLSVIGVRGNGEGTRRLEPVPVKRGG